MVYRAFAGEARFFRDRKPFRALNRDEVSSVQIAGEAVCTYSENEPGWKESRIDELLELLLDFQVLAYEDNSEEVPALESTDVEIILYGKDRNKIALLSVKGSVLQNDDNADGHLGSDDAPRYV